MALTMVEQSLMFHRRNVYVFPAVIAVCLDHVGLSVIETLTYLLVSDVSSILLWMAYDVLWASLVFFGITLMAVLFPGLNSICQSFSHCSSDDRSDWRACWPLSLVMLLKRRQLSANSLVQEERTTSGRSIMYERKGRGRRTVLWCTRDVTLAWVECIPSSRTSCVLSAKNYLIEWNVFSLLLNFMKL